MTIRTLRITELTAYPDKPFLRLHGKWLAEAGFHINQDVEVKVRRRKITITPHNPKQEKNDV